MDSDYRGNWAECLIHIIPIVRDSLVVAVVFCLRNLMMTYAIVVIEVGVKTVTCCLFSVKNVKSSETNAYDLGPTQRGWMIFIYCFCVV